MHQNHHHEPEVGTAVSKDDQAVCPVMHIPVSKKEAEANGLARTYKGQTYYLCCHTCAEMFDSNPEQYAAK